MVAKTIRTTLFRMPKPYEGLIMERILKKMTAIAAFFVGFFFISKFSFSWESQANPIPATIVESDGSHYTGSLSYNFNGTLTLVDDENRTLVFEYENRSDSKNSMFAQGIITNHKPFRITQWRKFLLPLVYLLIAAWLWASHLQRMILRPEGRSSPQNI